MKEQVISFFESINAFPRGSGNEKAVSDYLLKFAQDRGLWVLQDSFNNVIIKKNAALGYENAPTVILQAHMDMVCEKNCNINHDFLVDPIKLVFEGDFIKANGTTLGADNGIGVAMIMAILDNNKLQHPAIEALFTVNEETGMNGALAFDTTLLSGSILINLDSGAEDMIIAGCCGGIRNCTDLPMETSELPASTITCRLDVNGFLGGHSGEDIDKGRGNAIRCLARILSAINTQFCLISLEGGEKANAIPRVANAIIAIEATDYEAIKNEINELLLIIKNEYGNIEPNININIKQTDYSFANAFSEQTKDKLIDLLLLIPNGVLEMSKDIEGLVDSSNNVGVVRTDFNNKVIHIDCDVRSNYLSKSYYYSNIIKRLAKLAGGTYNLISEYPPWQFKKESNLRNLVVEAYKDINIIP